MNTQVQGYLTAKNDLSKKSETISVVEEMIEALNRHEIHTMDRYFAPDFHWMGNTGCGVKKGLKAFQEGWQRPFQAAFSEKIGIEDARICDGEWMSSFGSVWAKHTGYFMGIAPTGRQVDIRYMDFWHVRNGKIVDNWVNVDFPYVLAQLGVDCFRGFGWETYDENYDCAYEKTGVQKSLPDLTKILRENSPHLTPDIPYDPKKVLPYRFSQNNDLGKTAETRQVIQSMVDALNRHEINTMDRYFSEDFHWIGNTGCGVKKGLASFQAGWQKPFQATFSGKKCTDEARLCEGEWASCFGAQRAKHSGYFMGIAPTGKDVEIRYMDFWHVRGKKILNNWVMIDFPHVMAQLGKDCFAGKGWDSYDEHYDCANEEK